MRVSPACIALLAAACGSTGAKSRSAPFHADQVIRVVLNQYRGAGSILVVENLAGRDLVQLRSRALQPGETPVAYVDDEVMEEMLKEFERGDFYRYARPRPAHPSELGAAGELTITAASGRRLAFLRFRAPEGTVLTSEQVATAKAYAYCTETFREVWRAYPPTMQATTSRDPFKTKPKGAP
jgi:hypothetical protein